MVDDGGVLVGVINCLALAGTVDFDDLGVGVSRFSNEKLG